MNAFHKKQKRVLAMIAGVMFFGLIANIVNKNTNIEIVQKDYAAEFEQQTYLSDVDTSHMIDNIQVEQPTIEIVDIPEEPPVDMNKVNKLQIYLSNRGAPLAQYATEMVKAADHYGIDYRLVAAISIIESSGGKYCFKPHNAWGWGKMSFESFTQGIWTVSEGLAKYYSYGMTTPKLIAPSYCPPSATQWGNKVQFVMNEIENIYL